MRREGSLRARAHAVHSPVYPPPTMQTSTSVRPDSEDLVGGGPPRARCQYPAGAGAAGVGEPSGRTVPALAGVPPAGSEVKCTTGSDPRPRFVQDGAQRLADQVEVLLLANQRGGELDDGFAAVVGAAHQACFEQCR